ncbi:Protein CBG10051 [Caenorhabditis briggsae]|uniref:Uncharacterized protein n=3 Tax=Caenorhabditis briggsae TaxID=6238 RepID=A0AAE9DE36_CAEBR|nr:Protein CBG10051 [Caenorhabditis briggsae]ULU01953.1 hypothetical protein L3Y34_001914 [Caenorhabditis briggsae]CAP29564.1 Protein CBG10051 [Caenorhabditis briggsae]
MSNFYERRVLHSMESPMLCDFIPVKLVVLVVQIATLLITVGVISRNVSLSSESAMFEIFVVVFLVASVVSFLADYELFMHIHYWVVCVLIIVPLYYWGQSIVNLYNHIFNNSESPAVFSFATSTFILCSYIFYIWSCRQLIISLGRKYVLPFFKS